MPYAGPADLPPSFKNLTDAQKKKAVQMLNAMLADGMKESEAIPTVLKRVQDMKLSASVHGIFKAPAFEADADGVSPEFVVMAAGKFVRGGEDMPVTETDLDQMVRNFEAMRAAGQDIPVDYDHSFAESGDSRAAGWFAALRRVGDKLLARIKWTGEALDKLKSGEYRYFSPEWSANWHDAYGKGLGYTLLAGGLTNRPFLPGMTRVAFSVEQLDGLVGVGETPDDNQPRMADPDTKPAAESPGTPDPGTPPAPAPSDPGNPPTDPPAPSGTERDESDSPTDKTPETVTAAADKGETVTMSADEARKLRADASKVQALSQRLDKMEGDLKDARFTELFSQAKRDGKVDAKPESEAKWRKRFDSFGESETRELLNELPTHIPVDERGAAGEVEEFGQAADGVDPESSKADKLIQNRAKEKDIAYSEAFNQLVDEGVIA